MQPASLEILEKADVPSGQARAIVQAIEIEIAGAKETLATKQDILILRHEMAEMRTELRQEMAELRTELRQEVAELRTELRQEITDMRHSLHLKIASTVTQSQLYGAMLGQMAVVLGIAYFFVTHVQH